MLRSCCMSYFWWYQSLILWSIDLVFFVYFLQTSWRIVDRLYRIQINHIIEVFLFRIFFLICPVLVDYDWWSNTQLFCTQNNVSDARSSNEILEMMHFDIYYKDGPDRESLVGYSDNDNQQRRLLFLPHSLTSHHCKIAHNSLVEVYAPLRNWRSMNANCWRGLIRYLMKFSTRWIMLNALELPWLCFLENKMISLFLIRSFVVGDRFRWSISWGTRRLTEWD